PSPLATGRGADPVDVVVADREHDVGSRRVGPAKADGLDAGPTALAVGGAQTGAGLLDRHPISTKITIITGRLTLESATARGRCRAVGGFTLRRRALLDRLGETAGVAATGGPERVRGAGALLLCAGQGQGEREQDQTEDRESSHDVPP